ncbi:amino acid adenylation domain-containing protein [Dapis sp. BLCC M126]
MTGIEIKKLALPTEGINDIVERSNLTSSQLLLWLGQKLNPETPLYNMVWVFTIDGEIDPVSFQQAFQTLVNNSDALRTVIEEVDGIPQQRVLTTLTYNLPLLDFTAEVDTKVALQNWIQEQCKQTFNLETILFDSALIQVSSKQFVWYLNQHHLITDAWSVMLVYRYMSEFYGQYVEGTLVSPKLPTYAEYIAYEKDSQNSPLYKKAIDYWQQKQDKSLEAVIFYGKSINKPSSRTQRVSYNLGTERLSQKLRAMATEKDIRSLSLHLSLFNIFATVLFAYLYRIGGQETLAISTPVHNRPTTNFKETIGVFIELFPFQIEIEAGETFLSLFKKVQKESGAFLRYAQPGASSTAINRGINVVLNYINASLPDFNGLPMQSEWVHSGYVDSQHHLRLQVHDFDASGDFLLHFDFNTDLFDEKLQHQAIAHFINLLKGFIEDRSQVIDRVNLVGEEERKYLLEEQISPPIFSDDLKETVVQKFEAQVESNPEAIALQTSTIIGEEKQVTYRNFNEQVNQLAHYLKKQGVGAEVPVGILMRRSLQTLIAIWGILKAGGAYVPIEPNYPPERIAFILEDTQVPILLTEEALVKHWPSDRGFEIVQLDRDWEKISDESSENLESDVKPEHLAYIIYTSGSTGQPKGVTIEHRGLINYVSWAQQQYLPNHEQNSEIAFPLFSPLSFDLTVTSIFVPLLSGGRVVIYAENTGEIDLSIQRIVEENAVDIIKLTPSHLSIIKDMDLSKSRIKKMILGGEDLKTSLAKTVTDAFNGEIEIYNEYGPTEATVGCMIYRFDPQQDKETSVPIGKPAAQSRIYLLDNYLNLVPQGVVGEIYIASPGLARGYLNRQELTQERFIPNPFHPKERIYKTGDLGRWQENGQLQYLGRGDRQVKIRGTRIELGEVEAALSSHPMISDCVVDVSRQNHQLEIQAPLHYCTKCGISSNYPDITFDSAGVCNICRSYESYKHKAQKYFKTLEDLQAIFNQAKTKKQGEYDCLMLLSGGKDSTYVLYQLVEMGLKVLAFTLDNGYISEQAKGNIRRVVESLGVEHIFGTTPAMNAIFVDSLKRHCNVCNGCFKTIYTLSMKLADQKGIPIIVTGLSRGQFFETRLTEELFTKSTIDIDEIDEMVLAARKAYHRVDDAIFRELDVAAFQDDSIFEKVQIIDFYRYCDVELDEMLTFLKEKAPWIRPSDTGRSTNCLINNVGIHIHTQKQGYHNYALPYSWDVRLGHKERDAALEELNDEINVENVQQILGEIGYTDTEEMENRLVAYYVSTTNFTPSDLRIYLAQKLPNNTIPAYFVPLDKIPLTSNGKLDRQALPNPENIRPELKTAFIAPSTPIENTLAQLWIAVLKVDRVGIHDNFFDLGGDSIMAIQIAAKANEAGLHLSPNQLFQHPTIARLSHQVNTSSNILSEQGIVTGSIPLTPIQHSFFTQNLRDPHHYNQTLLLEVSENLDSALLEKAVQQLLIHHDALRLRFIQESSAWHQFNLASVSPVEMKLVDLSEKIAAEQNIAMTAIEEELQTSLNLSQGELIRIAFFNLGVNRPNRLLIIIHHLAVDGVSWLILLQDLQTLCQQLRDGKTMQLPLKTTSFKHWSEKLVESLQSGNLQSETDYWLQQSSLTHSQILLDDRHGENTEASSNHFSVSLSKKETQALLQEVPTAYHTQINEILLTALILSFPQNTQQRSLQVDLEGHGREENMVKEANLTRTVGWFTSVFPVTLTVEDISDIESALKSVKEQLRKIPNRGIGYGMLRYLSPDAALIQRLESVTRSEILFNYLGRMEQLLPEDSPFVFARELTLSRSLREKRQYVLEINAFIIQEQLRIDWRYSRNLHQETTIQQIANDFLGKLRSLIEHCLSSEEEDYTPDDFPLAKLDEQKLSKLSNLLRKSITE